MDRNFASTDLEALARALIEAARRNGADQADALAVEGRSISVDVRGGALEQAEQAEGTEIGLRVLIGGRQACVSASDHSKASIDEMALRAVAMAREAPVDDALGLADPDQLTRHTDAGALELSDPQPDPAPDYLQAIALRAEAAARAHTGISQVEAASAAFSRRKIWLAASNGFSGGYERSSHVISTVAITGEGLGMERDYAAESRSHGVDLPEPEYIGNLAAERTLARAGSRKPPTGTFPILYDRRVSSSLIAHLLGAVNGSAVARGASWLRKELGEQVLPEGMDLTEDPLRPRYSFSRPFDAEGLAVRKRGIVTNGILQGWTLDLATGRKLGMDSTASAARGLTSAPSPSSSNVILTQGSQTQDQLIADMGRGLIVTSMLGASINDTTGDYSRGAAGFWVENGQIAYPVNECTIAGNLRDMLMALIAANDALPWRGHEVPSLLVEGMTVAGAESDLELLEQAAIHAGEIALGFWRGDLQSWDKADDAGPVSEADLAVNQMLHDTLRTARPDYGWLSEESEADPSRLDAKNCFIIDPIDGTRAFIAGQEGFSHSLAVTDGDRVVAAVVHLPAMKLTYSAHADGPARLNGQPIAPSDTGIDGATVLTYRAVSDPSNWRDGQVPPFRREFRPSLAWRLCLAAEGRFDAAVSLRLAWEWDIAAGSLIAERAGGRVTDRHGERMRFNSARAMVDGLIVAGVRLHDQILGRLDS